MKKGSLGQVPLPLWRCPQRWTHSLSFLIGPDFITWPQLVVVSSWMEEYQLKQSLITEREMEKMDSEKSPFLPLLGVRRVATYIFLFLNHGQCLTYIWHLVESSANWTIKIDPLPSKRSNLITGSGLHHTTTFPPFYLFCGLHTF